MKILIPFLVPLALYGCFGSDDNASTSLSGTVADGYIENATVCFDANGNLTCDDSEPTTTTAADGTYSVTASGSVEGLAVIAVVGPDSKDSDDNGQTMAEAGKEGFNFMAPAENPEVVSPLSTLVQFEIISNPDFSLDEAQGAVKETLGIDDDDINLLEYDFVEAAATGNAFATNIKKVTEVLSSALGDVTKNMSDDTAIATLKAGGDDGMIAFQTGIMDMIKETIIPATVAGGTVTGEVSDLKKQLRAAIKYEGTCPAGATDCDASGSFVTRVKDAQIAKKKAVKVAATAGAQTISDVKAIMENGVVIGYPVDDVNYLNSSGVETPIGADSTGLFIEYHKMATNGEYFAEKILIEGKWYDAAPKLIGSMEFDSKWTMDPKTGIWSPGDMPFDSGGGPGDYSGGSPSDHMPTFSKGCMSFPGSYSEKLCFRERDLSGKSIGDIMCPDGTSTGGKDEFCDNLAGSSAKFKTGSKGLDVSISNNFDLYQVNVDPCVFDSSATAAEHPATSNCDIGFTDGTSPIKDLDTFKSTYSLSETTMGYIGNNCNVVFTFDNQNILFADGGSCSIKKTISAADGEGVESLPFEILTVGTSKVIVSGVPQIFREKNPGDLPVGAKILFAAFATNGSLIMNADTNPNGMGVYSGYFILSGVSQKYSFDTGEEKIGTYQFLDSIIESQSWDAFPYPTSTYEEPQTYMPGQGGSEAECTAWLNEDSSTRQALPGFGCFDFCAGEDKSAGTCASICAAIDSSEQSIWGCP